FTLPPRTILSSKSTKFTDYNLRLRSLLRSNTDNTQQITDLSNRFTGFEVKMDNFSLVWIRPFLILLEIPPRIPPSAKTDESMKHFMKDPMALHRSIHTSVELLKYSGENFIAWQQQLDTTLDFVFLTDRFTEKERWSKLSAEHEPSVTLLMRGSVEPLLYKTVRTTRKPADIYQTLKTRCKRSDRQRKIGIVNKLKDFYAYEQQDSNAELIAQFQDFFLEVSQQNLSLDELLGLVLQSVAKPLSVSTRNVPQQLNHCLNSANPAPLLDAVCQELTQVKGELHTGTSTNPILINRLHPGGDNHSRSKNNSSGKNTSTFGHKAITNALAFQGQQPSTALMAAKGDTCKYCEIKGHWASTCRKFARDLRNGKINIAQFSFHVIFCTN
ncbi:hypothetical protein PSTT_03893, partial [Puccinia striiformis]